MILNDIFRSEAGVSFVINILCLNFSLSFFEGGSNIFVEGWV